MSAPSSVSSGATQPPHPCLVTSQSPASTPITTSSQSPHVTRPITSGHTPLSTVVQSPPCSVQSPPSRQRFTKSWQNSSALIAMVTVPVVIYYAIKTYSLAAWTAKKDYCEYQQDFGVSSLLHWIAAGATHVTWKMLIMPTRTKPA